MAGTFTFLLSGLTRHSSIIFTFALCVAINYCPKSMNYFQRTKSQGGAQDASFLLSGLTGHPSIIFTFVLCMAINYCPKSINYFQRTKGHIFKG